MVKPYEDLENENWRNIPVFSQLGLSDKRSCDGAEEVLITAAESQILTGLVDQGVGFGHSSLVAHEQGRTPLETNTNTNCDTLSAGL